MSNANYRELYSETVVVEPVGYLIVARLERFVATDIVRHIEVIKLFGKKLEPGIPRFLKDEFVEVLPGNVTDAEAIRQIIRKIDFMKEQYDAE